MIRPLVFLIGLIMGGPGLASPLLGTWQCASEEPLEFFFVGTVSYKKNGQVYFEADAKGTFPDGSIAVITVNSQADWRLEGDDLYETNYRNTQISRLIIDGVDETDSRRAKDMVEQFNTSSNDETPSKITFLTNDTFRLLDGTVQTLCTRLGVALTN